MPGRTGWLILLGRTDLQCLDRIYLNAYVPTLQVGGQAVAFPTRHLQGEAKVSTSNTVMRRDARSGSSSQTGCLRRTGARLCEAGLERVEVIQAEARELLLADASLDHVVNSYMLDLLPQDDIPRPRELWRVLRPGGRLVLSNMTRAETRHRRIWDALSAGVSR